MFLIGAIGEGFEIDVGSRKMGEKILQGWLSDETIADEEIVKLVLLGKLHNLEGIFKEDGWFGVGIGD